MPRGALRGRVFPPRQRLACALACSARRRGRHEVTDAAIQSLPGRIRLRLDQTLAQWGQWQCDPPLATRPAPREVLGDGISNFSVLVGNHPRFVVRLDGVDPTANGLHRQVEWRRLKGWPSVFPENRIRNV